MNYRFKSEPGVTIVSLEGVLDFDQHDKFRDMIRSLTKDGASDVTLDLTCLDMIDSAGIGMLLYARDRLKEAGAGFSLTGANGRVEKVFQLTRLHTLIDVA